MKQIWLVKTKEWGYCALFPDDLIYKWGHSILRGLWHHTRNPLLVSSYGKIASYPRIMRKREPYIKVMPITKITAHRAAKFISNNQSKYVNLRKWISR